MVEYRECLVILPRKVNLAVRPEPLAYEVVPSNSLVEPAVLHPEE